MSNASPPTCVFVKVLRDGNVLHATAMVAIDGLPAPCTCSMLLERLYPGAVPPDGTVTAKGFSDPHFQLIGQTEVNLTYDIRYLASTGYLWVVYTITSPTTSIPTTTPTPPANAFARLFAGAQNAFALLLPDKTTGVKVNDEFKNELIEMMRGMGAGVKTRQDLLDLIKFTHALRDLLFYIDHHHKKFPARALAAFASFAERRKLTQGKTKPPPLLADKILTFQTVLLQHRQSPWARAEAWRRFMRPVDELITGLQR
jgi:hypothetical protein